MFYDVQPNSNKLKYKEMLNIIGQLSRLFSDSTCPYLPYRVHENIFCKYLDAVNLARLDCSADAKKENIGIGLKTWMGNDDQKVAEFGKNKSSYNNLSGLELIKKIAEYRNERIRVTKNLHGIETMIYHIVKRIPGAMQILECTLDYIDIDSIRIIPNRGNVNNTYFHDGRHNYHFSSSKNTLYMIFEDLELLDTIEVNIMDDPFTILYKLFSRADVEEPLTTQHQTALITPENNFIEVIEGIEKQINKPILCLPLYTTRGSRGSKVKYVAEKSGLNQWNASGRKRDADEVYIPYNKVDRDRFPEFFPPRDTPFTLHLPDGTITKAKVCQEVSSEEPLVGKAIMSNPNKLLGNWLLRKVFELQEKTLVTYEMLELFGIDSVIFTKNEELDYSVDFAEIGTYEKMYGLDEENVDEEE